MEEKADHNDGTHHCEKDKAHDCHEDIVDLHKSLQEAKFWIPIKNIAGSVHTSPSF